MLLLMLLPDDADDYETGRDLGVSYLQRIGQVSEDAFHNNPSSYNLG